MKIKRRKNEKSAVRGAKGEKQQRKSLTQHGSVREKSGDYKESVIVIWTDYFKYRVELRGFEFSEIENTLRYSTERYFDTTTRQQIDFRLKTGRFVYE